MAIERPGHDEIAAIAAALHMHLPPSTIADYRQAMQANFDAYDLVDALADFVPPVKYPRQAGQPPASDGNPLGAWHHQGRIEGAASGPLAGMEVVIKDNIAIAGWPMLNGSATLDGYVPDVDATVVTRLLDAGATVVGKAVCEGLCFSGGSHTAASGPVHNPHRHGYSSGGSSSGCGALVGAGTVRLAVGSDQGGSVRIPSAFCGAYGMKATYGLVPYTGAMPIEATLDNLGPITASVTDNALMLEVLAGVDGLDPRQAGAGAPGGYTAALQRGVAGMKIGLLREGFGHANAQPDVERAVRAAADVLRRAGAVVEEVSVPMHALGPAIWTPIAAEGATRQMMQGNSHGGNWRGLYLTGMIAHHAGWRRQADALPDTVKLTMILGEYFTQRYQGHHYAKAQNLARQLRAAYDQALRDVDLLLMPTLPIKASRLPAPGAALDEYLARAFEMLGNTCAFNVSGHPAMSIPCGSGDGLPIGLQLVGRYFGEADIYRAAYAFEHSVDWRRY